MAATTHATSLPSRSSASATGYEAFLEDTKVESSKVDLSKIQEQSSSETKEQPTETSVGESWKRSITEGAQRAQGIITDYFPPKSPCGLHNGNPCSDMKNPCTDKTKDKGGEVPELTESSSSENSTSSKGKLAQWADKVGSCHLDTACGKLDIEFMKKEKEPVSQGNAISEQGELLKIEGPPPPKPWTEELSDKAQEAQSTLSTRTSRLLVALGLAPMKDQHLITDYFKPKPPPKQPEKSLSERIEEARVAASTTATTVMSMLNLGPKAKEMKQKLMTDYDPTKLPAAAGELTEDATPSVVSIATEQTELNGGECPTPKDQPKLSLWQHLKGFVTKFKLPEKTPMCENMFKCEDIAIPSVPDACTPTEKVMAPLFGMFAKSNKELQQVEKKVEELVENEKEGKKEVEKEQMDPGTPQSPEESKVPW